MNKESDIPDRKFWIYLVGAMLAGPLAYVLWASVVGLVEFGRLAFIALDEDGKPIPVGDRLQAVANLIGAILGGFFAIAGAFLVFWLGRREAERQRLMELQQLSQAVLFRPMTYFAPWPYTVEKIISEYSIGKPRNLALLTIATMDIALPNETDLLAEFKRRRHLQARLLSFIERDRAEAVASAKAIGNDAAWTMYEGSMTPSAEMRNTEMAMIESLMHMCASIGQLIRDCNWYSNYVEVSATSFRAERTLRAILEQLMNRANGGNASGEA